MDGIGKKLPYRANSKSPISVQIGFRMITLKSNNIKYKIIKKNHLLTTLTPSGNVASIFISLIICGTPLRTIFFPSIFFACC